MGKVRTSVYVPEQQKAAVEDLVAASRDADTVPDMSEAEVWRRIFEAGLSNDPDLEDLLTEERRILLKREEFIDCEGQVRNLRSTFRSKVKDKFTQRFESGLEGTELEEFAENMKRDALLLWPEWSPNDYAEQREEAIDYVEDVCAAAIKAQDESAFDPLDPEGMFDHYGGVEDGRHAAEVRDELIEDAATMLRSDLSTVRFARDPEDVVGALTSRCGVTEEIATSAVEAAVERVENEPDDDQGGIAEVFSDD